MTPLLKPLTASLLILMSAITPLYAASSAWVDLGGGKARLVADYDPGSGNLKSVIEVKLKNGWSTYWRYPGSTGIPPRFDFSASKHVSFNPVAFPTPSLQKSGDAYYAGYKKSVLFPVDGKVSQNQLPDLNLDMLIGVCEEICIPAQANFNISTDKFQQSDPVAKRIISFANLNMPEKMKASDIGLEMHRLSETSLKIEFAFALSDEEPALFVEGPSNWYLTPAKFKSSNNGKLTFHLDLTGIPKGAVINSGDLNFTLVVGRKGFEIRD